MRRPLRLAALLCALAASVTARSAYGSSVLVVLDADQKEGDYSRFFASLRERGFDLTLRTTKEGPRLFQFDEPAYDHLVLLAPSSKGITDDLSPQSLYNFVATSENRAAVPHNILIGLDSGATEPWRDFAREFSIEFESKGSVVTDYFASSAKDGTLSVKPYASSADYSPVLSEATLAGPAVVFKGLAHSVAADFPLATSFLSAPSTAFSVASGASSDDDNVPFSPLSLVTGFQATNNARILWSGSVALFSDAYASSNEAFVKDVTSWVLGEQGVLRVENVLHRKVGEEVPREQYRVKDDWTYSAEISEWRGDAWRPVNLPELQLELTMLDPHLRVPLLPSAIERTTGTSSAADTTLYAATAKLPTRHGVFTARLRHLRTPALSWLDETVRFSITPPRHDEWPRFIVGAWPYYLGAFSTAVSWWIFSAIWVSLDPRDSVGAKMN